MDGTDVKILELLQANARIPYSTIAREVHLSVTAVTRRIERLEDSGVILGYRTEINGEKAGLGIHGFIVAGAWQTHLEDVYRYLDTMPEIIRVETIISGGKELILEFYCRDTNALMELYKSDLRSYLETMTVYLVKDPAHRNVGVPLREVDVEHKI